MQIVFGHAKAIGEEITKSDLIRKIGFTGSTPVGKLLMAQAASTVKKVSLELGGNAPFIVFDDADLDLAVRGAIGSRFRNAGQTCICANRIYVQEKIYPAFLEAFKKRVQAIKTGNGMEAGVTMVRSFEMLSDFGHGSYSHAEFFLSNKPLLFTVAGTSYQSPSA